MQVQEWNGGCVLRLRTEQNGMSSFAARVRWVVCVVVAVGVLTGCRTHQRVSIDEAPAEDAPRSERLAYHRTHKGTLGHKSYGNHQAITHLQLENGTRVEHPADLLPAVGEETPSGDSTLRFVEAEEAYGFWLNVALWAIPVGLGLPAVLFGAGVGLALVTQSIGASNAVNQAAFAAPCWPGVAFAW